MNTFDITTFDSSHLKGIVNTNDDPLLCALCTEVPDYGSFIVHACCGKAICAVCGDAPTKKPDQWSCPFCGGNPYFSVGAVKKHAKGGRAWAQSLLARQHYKGEDGLTQSMLDAVRWYRKAVAKNHPLSVLQL